MKTKQEVIQESYGEAWEKVKDVVDGQGGIYITKFTPESCGFEGEVDYYHWNYWKPRSLRMVLNNNGWNKYPDVKPNDKQHIHFCFEATNKDDIAIYQGTGFYRDDPDSYWKDISHWMPVKKIIPPLY